MKKMQIFEPALCCETGVCGASVDPELLRISTVINTLKKNGIVLERFNLNNAPMEFVTNHTINVFVNEKGVEALPCVTVDGEIVIEGRYPTNEEILNLLELPPQALLPADLNCCGENCCTTDDCSTTENCCTTDDCCTDSDGGCC